MSEHDDRPGPAGLDQPDEALTADPRWGDLDADPALASAILEIEQHLSGDGWDQPARLYALVDTAALVRQEPALASAMGLDAAAEEGSLTAVEQDQMDPSKPLEGVLESIEWPTGVAGCAAMVERLVLPPGSDATLPEDPVQARAFAREHPDRQEVRIVAGATRSGSTYCALRLRASTTALLLDAESSGWPILTAVSISLARILSFLATRLVTLPVAPARAVRPDLWM